MSKPDLVKPTTQQLFKPMLRLRRWVIIFCMLIVGMSVAVSLWRLFSLNHGVASSISQLNQEIATLRSQLNATQEKVVQMSGLVQTLRYSGQVERHIVLNGQSAVQQAAHYLSLANDIPRARYLLSQTQQEMQQLSSAQALPLQKALEQDLNTLNHLPWMNPSAIYMRLVALERGVKELKVALIPVSQPIASVPTSKLTGSLWKRGWQSFKNGLREMVLIYHVPTSQVPPLVTPAETPYLYQNVLALLNQAKWAVLYQDNTVYQASLQQSISWVQQYFIQEEALTQSTLAELRTLQALKLSSASQVSLVSSAAFTNYLKNH